MVINQGDIFWLTLAEPAGSSPGYRHPHVVIQNNLFNQSRIHTAVVCTLTTNLKRAAAPGNVLLDSGEGGLANCSSLGSIAVVIWPNWLELRTKVGFPGRRLFVRL